MVRKIVHIDEEKCNGCGACAAACHEGAIAMIDGKARLIRDDYCDGMGDCLPECPVGAIHIEERESLPYDAAAVAENMKKKEIREKVKEGLAGGCPGTRMRQMMRKKEEPETEKGTSGAGIFAQTSELTNWPVQIKLAPVHAPYFEGAKLLIAADCTAYSYGNFHQEFIRGKVTLIGCPKLDAVNYAEKLTQIIAENNIKFVTVVRMEVPCCGGLEFAVKEALKNSGKMIPWQVVTISIDGQILDD